MKKVLILVWLFISAIMGYMSIQTVSKIDQQRSFSFLYTNDNVWRYNIANDTNKDITNQLQQFAKEEHLNMFFTKTKKIFYPNMPVQEEFEAIVGNPQQMNEICSDWENDHQCQIEFSDKKNQVTIKNYENIDPTIFYISGNIQELTDIQTKLSKLFPDMKVTTEEMPGYEIHNSLVVSMIGTVFMEDTKPYLVAIIVLLVITLLYFVDQSKTFAVKNLHGYAFIRTYLDEMKEIIKIGCICTVIIFGIKIIYLFIMKTAFKNILFYLWINLLSVLFLFILYLLLSFPSLYLCTRQKIVNLLKGKLNLRPAKITISVLKVILVSLCIVSSCEYMFSIERAYHNIQHKEVYEKLCTGFSKIQLDENWNYEFDDNNYFTNTVDALSKKYELIYWRERISVATNVEIDLYDEIGRTTNYEYINRLKLIDVDGNVVHIEPQSGKHLLMSEKYKDQQKEIEKVYPILSTYVTYLKEDQPIFLFDVQDKKYATGKGEDYVLFTDTQLLTSSMNQSYIYFKATPEELKATLQEAGIKNHLLYDDLAVLSSYEYDRWMKRAENDIFNFLVYFTMIIVILSMDISFYKKSNWKQIMVRQLLGYSERRIHRKKILKEIGFILIECILSYFIMFVYGHNGYYTDYFIFMMITITVLDFIMFSVSMYLMNRNTLQENLKK